MALTIKKALDVDEKLTILSQDSRYDLACACAVRPEEHRHRSKDDKWVYPVILPNGLTTFLFKTLLFNECVNNCKYCPLRVGSDVQRCGLSPEELVQAFLSYYKARKVSGLFLSSAVLGSPDRTMEQINRSAYILRRMNFRGYIHLKIIPGASDAAIQQSVALANAVSLNIESPTEESFRYLSTTKDFLSDVIRPIHYISRLTEKGSRYEKVKHTTQFVVGASKETDKEIVWASGKLYSQLGLDRVYFSAYQRGAGALELPGEHSIATNADILSREHRLYQADWLMRKYGFKANEIPFEANGYLSLQDDPKQVWAKLHPEFFPVNVNKDGRWRLLRVPGLGHVMVERVLAYRRKGIKIKSLAQLAKLNKVLAKAADFITF
ncbi:MAG: radical SAM protein [Candidatus Omnitrophota bacterium]